MPDSLSYECPHCHTVISVASSALGETVKCTQCSKPFRADVPIGRQVGTGSSGAPQASRTDNEQVLLRVNPVVFRAHLLLTSIALLLVVTGVVGLVFWLLDREALGMTGMTLLVVSVIGILIAAGLLGYEWLQAWAVQMTITNQRTMVRKGIFSKSTNEVQHSDVRNIQCDQNILERLLNYGDIALSSAAQNEMEIVVNDIPDPQRAVALIRRHQ